MSEKDQQSTSSSSSQRNEISNSSQASRPNSQHINLSSIAPSPPKFVEIDEIMKASNSVTNMYLSHSIAVDEDFKFQKADENSLRGQVESVIKSTFWKILESQLTLSPPVYKQAIALLQEIKDEINKFLLPQHSKLKQEIDEILDLDLIKQQAEFGAVDFQRYNQYILSVLSRLCAPIRDERINELSHSTDLIFVFKGIMELIELMKLDMANFTIKQMRPQIIQHSVEYEKGKFSEFLDVQKKMNIDGLQNTKLWLKRNYESLDLDDESKDSIRNKVIFSAFIELLELDSQLRAFFPETVSLDEQKIKELQIRMHIHLIVGSVILVVFASVPSLQQIANLKEKFKSIINILFTSDMEIVEKIRLENIALQLIKEIQANLKQNNLPLLDKEKELSLSDQIIDLSNLDNRVRNIVHRRIVEFVEQALINSAKQSASTNLLNDSSLQIPTGLSILKDELLAITGEFLRFVSFNRSVFNDYYDKIIDALIAKN